MADVLLIEDDDMQRAVAGMALRRAGRSAATPRGEAAFELLGPAAP